MLNTLVPTEDPSMSSNQKATEVSEIGQSQLDSICDEADKLKAG